MRFIETFSSQFFPKLLLVFLSLLDSPVAANTLVTQKYPFSVGVPFQLTDPTLTGACLTVPLKNIFLHAGLKTDGSGILQGMHASGSELGSIGSLPNNVKAITNVGNTEILVFGDTQTAILRVIDLPGVLFTLSLVTSPGQSLNVQCAWLATTTSFVYVGTAAPANIQTLDFSSKLPTSPWDTPVPQPDHGSILVIKPFGMNLIVGGDLGLTIVDRTTKGLLLKLNGYTNVAFLFFDSIYTQAQLYDFLASDEMKRVEIDGINPNPATLLTFSPGAAVSNVAEIPTTNYMIITTKGAAASVLAFKRTTYLLEQSLPIPVELATNTLACCFQTDYRYLFSAARIDRQFYVYEFSLEPLCALMIGNKCMQCQNGYKLSADLPLNQCWTPDEYPYRKGAFGKTIETCEDPQCIDCKGSHKVCNRCAVGFYVHPVNDTCLQATSLPEGYGVDVSANTHIRKCNSPICRFSLIQALVVLPTT